MAAIFVYVAHLLVRIGFTEILQGRRNSCDKMGDDVKIHLQSPGKSRKIKHSIKYFKQMGHLAAGVFYVFNYSLFTNDYSLCFISATMGYLNLDIPPLSLPLCYNHLISLINHQKADFGQKE